MIFIDATSGIAGNMIIGACIDLGVKEKELIKTVKKATDPFGQCDINIERIRRAVSYTHLTLPTKA